MEGVWTEGRVKRVRGGSPPRPGLGVREETCCWGKQFNRVYQQLLWEIAVNGAYVKDLHRGSCRGRAESLRSNRLQER